jgi:hypothetical protein
MRKFILVPLIALVAGLTACGSSNETTVIKKETATPSTTETSTTEAVKEEWPEFMQRAFIKGCGENQRCYCALDELMSVIPADELDTTGDISARYHDELVQAVKDCL